MEFNKLCIQEPKEEKKERPLSNDDNKHAKVSNRPDGHQTVSVKKNVKMQKLAGCAPQSIPQPSFANQTMCQKKPFWQQRLNINLTA